MFFFFACLFFIPVCTWLENVLNYCGTFSHFWSLLLVLCRPLWLAVLCCRAQSEDMQMSRRDSSVQGLLGWCCSTGVSGFTQAVLHVFSVSMVCLLNSAKFAQKSAAKRDIVYDGTSPCYTLHYTNSLKQLEGGHLKAPGWGLLTVLISFLSWPFISVTAFLAITVRQVTNAAGSSVDTIYAVSLKSLERLHLQSTIFCLLQTLSMRIFT